MWRQPAASAITLPAASGSTLMQVSVGHETPHTVEPGGDPVRVVQLTDTHLCHAPGGTLLGMDTDHAVKAVIELIATEQPSVDVLLATGDLSDNGSVAAYHRLQDYYAGLAAHDFWLPGNHDLYEAMVSAARSAHQLCRDIRVGPWQIVMLDTQVPGEVGGHLGPAELARLQRILDAGQAAGLFSLVCMHHQPVAIGCAWLDEQKVSDAEAFFAIIDRYPAVQAVLWGHVHQQVDKQRKGVRLLASPSTCVQFAPASDDFRADDQSPGYRWLELNANGSITTGVSRVQGVRFNVDLDSTGYL